MLRKAVSIAGISGAMLALTSPPALAQTASLAPIDDWNVKLEDTYCELSRNFGDAGAPITMFIYSYGLTGGYRITLQGEELPRNTNKAQIGGAVFGDPSELRGLNIIVGRRGETGTVSFLTSHDHRSFFLGYMWSADRDIASGLDFEPYATRLTFDTPEMEPISLELGSLDSALSELAECEAALEESWDLDLPDTLSIETPASLGNGYTLARDIIRPPAMLINRSSQMVQLRMTVDETGELTDCVIQSPNWRGRDVRGVCRPFYRLGEFTPARNAEGEAVPSVLRGQYLMLIFD